MEDILIGVTDRSIAVFVPDPTSTTGAGKTGLAHSAITVSYTRVETDNDVIVTDVTSSLNALSSLTDNHNDWGWKEVSATLSPGVYRLDLADEVFASGAWYTIVSIAITSGLAAVTPKAFRLIARNDLDGVRLGLTALPNAAAEASGGLPTLSAAQASNGTIQANVHRWLTGTPNALQSGRVDSYIGAVASGAIAAASFAANALDAVWSTATRLLTAGTNIVLAKGTGVTGFNDLSAAQVNAEVDQAISDAALATAGALATVDTVVDAIQAKTDTLPTDPADASDIAAAFGTVNSTLATVAGYIDTEVAAIKAKTDNLPASPAASGDIPSATDVASAVRTELTTELGHLDADVSSRASQTSVDDLPTASELTAALEAADDAVLAAIAALNNLSAAEVKHEIVDALAVDSYGEPTGVPAAAGSIVAKLGRLHQALRNSLTVTSGAKTFKDDAGADLWQKALSDNGTTYTEGEAAAP